MKTLLAACACAVTVAAAGGGAAAQIALGPGAIVVRVRDAAGKPIAGAVVEADGAARRRAVTNAAGVVVFPALPVGTYDVAVSRAGFAPYAGRVAVDPSRGAAQVVAPTLGTASLAIPAADAAALALPALGSSLDPFAAHALAAEPETNVTAGPAGAAVSVDGTLPYESRVELDGIPLAGGADSPAAVRFRDLFGLTSIDVAAGPGIASPSLRDAVGGIVDFRTPALGAAPTAGVDAGYDSAFGAFQHLRAVRAFGNLSLAADVVTGGGADRSESLKAAYAFGAGLSLDAALYALQATGLDGTASLSASAPAFSAGLRASAVGGTFEARAFGSSLSLATAGSAAPPPENARTHGFTLGYDVPLGDDRMRVTFDRRGEDDVLGNAPAVAETFTTLSGRADVALAHGAGLELADGYSGGTLVRARNDPAAVLTVRPAANLTLRLAAGSDFATAPDALLAERTGSAPALAPETAFGYRATLHAALGSGTRAWVTAYDERRFDLFATLPDAADRGADVGFSREPSRGFGATAYVALARSVAYGAAQPAYRVAPGVVLDGAGANVPGAPFAKARGALSYRVSPSCDDGFGVTLVGANGALAPNAVLLGDASVCVSAFGAFVARAGEHNIFGATVTDPALAPLFARHEFTLTVGSR